MTNNRLASKQGASLTEFLLLSPILVFLGFIAVDINRRIEESQRVTIASRNAMQVSAHYNDSDLNGRIRSQLKEESSVLDPGQKQFVRDLAEANELDQIAANLGQDFGMKVDLTDGLAVPYDRIKQQPGVVLLDENGQPSAFNQIARATGTLTAASSQVVSGMMGAGSTVGFLIPDRLRQSTVAIRTSGASNAIQNGMSILAEVSERDTAARTDILGIDRRFAHRSYLRVEDGYHPNEFQNSGLFAMGLTLVLNTGKWGYDGDFKQDSPYLQSRCMTRFMSDNRCDNAGNFVLNGPVYGSFPNKVRTLASAKYAYSTIATLGAWVPVAGQAAKGIDVAMSVAADAMLEVAQARLERAIKDELVRRLQNEMKDFARHNQNQISGASQSILGDMVGGFDTGAFHGILGE